MANLSKIKRDNMIAFLEQLKQEHADDASIRAFNEIENHLREKKYGLLWEEHSEEVDEMLAENIPILTADPGRRLCKDENLPWNFIIEGDNLQALYLLEKTHKGKVDCIYIDPPYNKGNKDWKYNNDYVDENDAYRHSKWLSMMKERLLVAKHLLNPEDSVLIVTIDEKEYAHLACLLEELFPNERIQMVSTVISSNGSVRKSQCTRVDEYIFMVEIGNSYVQRLNLSDDWRMNPEDNRSLHLRWATLMRTGSGPTKRSMSKTLFFPIFISEDGKRIIDVGEPVPLEMDRHEVKRDDCIAVWPIHQDGTEGCWNCKPEKLKELVKDGYVKLGRFNGERTSVNYLPKNAIQKIKDGIFTIDGYADDGSVISSNENRSILPTTQWKIGSHDATVFGSNLLKEILLDRKFPFPKSLYAVKDVISFFVKNKPNAIVVDFFAGSGTTMHAINLLNAEDGGKRTCIMVTNNELSAEEEQDFIKRGITKGSQQWEERGIAQYITWPRTVCSINGCDISGNPLNGTYGVEIETYKADEDSVVLSKATGKPTKTKVYKKEKTQAYPALDKIKKSDGFQTNVKYFRCDWTPRKPEDYLLSNVLCLHIREMIELQNAIEVDNVKNVLILNKSDFKNIILNPDIYAQIENVWVNQNIVLNAEELKLLEAKGFKYIPREFFGQELREAAE